ncbi:MAG: YbjN domain-containing protein [Nannocystaceae bacterium]
MGRIFDTLVNFFDQDEWTYEEADTDILQTVFEGERGQRWFCIAQARETEQQFLFFSIFPERVGENFRTVVMEFITRANFGLLLGNFELDLDDGELRFKTTIDIEDTELNYPLWRQVVYRNLATMDDYFGGLGAVSRGEALPIEALHAIENPPPSSTN